MDPRMKEKGIPENKNSFQIRNPWLPTTPGNPIGSRSNGISIDRNENNQLGRRNFNEFFNLLETPNRNLNKPPNQSSSCSYGMSDSQMGTGIMQGGNTINQIRSSNGTGDSNFIRVQNQICSSNGTGGYQAANKFSRGGNISFLTEPINQINSLNSRIGNGIVRGGNNSSNLLGILNQNNSNSNNMGDRQMRNEITREGNSLNLNGTENQGSSLNCHIRNGIIRGENSSNFTRIINQNSSPNSLGNRRMGNENLQGGNNFIFTAQKNRIISNSNGHNIGNEIIRGGNSSSFTGMLNQNSSSRSTTDHRMGNEILQSGNNFHPTGQMNQTSRSSNGAGGYMGNEIIRGGNSHNLTETTRQMSSFKSLGEHQMRNGIMRGSNNSNLTGITNQISTSYGRGEHTDNGIIRGGSRSSAPGTLNHISSSKSIGDHRMGNGIMQSGNNFNLNESMVQFRSSDGNGNHIGNGFMQGGDDSTFTGLLNQISSSDSMGTESLGHCLNSQRQTFHNENTVQKSSFLATNMTPISVANTNSSSPVLNLNMQPLSSPRVTNTPNAPLILNSYSEVDSSWTQGNFTSLLLGDEIPELGPNNFLNANDSLQMLNNGFSVPALQDNNPNSPARTRDPNSFPFAPITPDQRNLFEKQQQAAMMKFLADDSSCQEQDKMQNLLSPIQKEAIENQCSELLQTIVSSASTVLSTPQVENKITEERGDQDVIDLNETPKQKTPKRRKHRPKVVREGKPQRTPKPKTPKKGESEETPSRKRKYVRKNREPDVEIATPLQTDAANAPTIKSRKKSIRKRLNFDLEKSEMGESQFKAARVQVPHHQGNQPVLDLNLNYPANQMQVESLEGKESHVSAATTEIITYKPSNEMTRNSNMGNNENRENKSLHGESNKNIHRSNINIEKKSMRWKSTHQMVERDVGNFQGFCGSKGEETNPTAQVGLSTEHKLGSSAMSQEPYWSENQETTSPNAGSSSEETRKKQKMENDFQTMLCGPEKEHSTNGIYSESTINDENHRKLTSSNQQKVQKKTKKKMSRKSAQAQSTGVLVVMPNSDLQSEITIKNVNTSGYQQEGEQCQASTQNDRHKITPNSCRVISFSLNDMALQGHEDTSHLYRQPSMKARGQPKPMKYSKKTVDEITNRLQALTISCHSGDTDKKDKYALVPYEGGGTMVPYEAKKRKPRPKVDLDPETNRIWKLLMGKEGCEASEAENKDKEKWWEEERRVFHGRAESFIARMHLVQGDRRFSPWKGSVVDSIIGVFLTQNVSDQLSSSAFMALAAQFPLGSNTPDQSGTSILTEDLEIPGLAPYGTTGCFEKTSRQPLYSQNSDTYLGFLGTERTGLATEKNRITQENSSSPQNSSDSSVHHINGELHSSSGSSSEAEDTSNGGKSINNNGVTDVQHTDRTAPLQVIDSMNSFSPLSHPIHSSISHMQNETMPTSFFQMLMASQVARSDVNCFEISREECRSSFHSRAPEMMSDTLFQQNGLQKSQTPNIDPFAFLTTHQTMQKSIVQQESQIGKDPQMEKSRIYEPEHPGFNSPIRPVEPVIKRKIGSGNQLPNVSNHSGQAIDIQEGTTAANKQVFLGDSGDTNIGISTKTMNMSQNREKEKREPFDWDSLRKTVHSNREKIKERTIDSSDSMDYEAMRCADVNIISNSIRMRGMNHMLAERIKDFLNRVATDHGSIDLEWLRDAPPDKVKDYLLSIRGLGLKSVECVRLLTLHHLAFPVDTNVGRIAVRLGWVPIQPLPESLQLHLLEMYPVLESVQKYLWPRLCKLDQKTLYELHYQLITFGKVFCTKSKPNCNACPMRGECRHFASAFASARLALPAPEEKGIVSSTMPITTDTRTDVASKPMLLQPSGKNGERELMVSRCEPIIEEPTTPEPEFTEITEADIEDAFYEDPDEIPTIRLNVEQLAVNLRNFMEEHTDLQEGDMSKALVALTPEVASIPMPKLKYVLRLRTERQVYVLPDTHPLVKGLDKREQDDPSPYLLALLTPGEEANSGQSSGEPDNEKDRCSVNGEENSLTVRGTLLIPCRTAMRGSFPLNGTYFQVNEVFADHESSLNPIDVPRAWLWHLEMRTVFFGTSATSIFRGMTTKEIQNSFWRGFVCVRGFDQKTRAPRPLNRNLHIPQSKTVKTSKAEL